MVRVLEINCLEELASFRLVWRKLLGQTRRATFFQSLDWLEPYLRRFGSEQKLRALFVSGSQGYLGILPLVVRREQTSVGPLRVLTYPLDDWGTFYGPIGPYPAATLLAGLAHLQRTRRDWDLLVLRWVNRDAVDFGRTSNAFQALELPAAERAGAAAAIVEVDGPWQGYWKSRDTHFRKNVERSRRKLALRGRVEYVRLSAGRHRPGRRASTLGFVQHLRTTGGGELARHKPHGQHVIARRRCVNTCREAHVAAVDAGAADLSLLYVDAKPMAFAYCYHFDGQVSGLRMGYDARAVREGAGSVLT